MLDNTTRSNSEGSADEYITVATLANFDHDLELVITNVLKIPLDNPIALAIHHFAGVKTWHQFKYMDECDVFEATYYDETNGTTKSLTKYEQKILRWLIGYVRDNLDDLKKGSEEASFYTSEAFTKYTQDRRRWLRHKAMNNRKTTTQHQQSQQSQPPHNQLHKIEESEEPPSSFRRMSTSAPNLGYFSGHSKRKNRNTGDVFPELKKFLDGAAADDRSLRSFLTGAMSPTQTHESDEEKSFIVLDRKEKSIQQPPTLPKRTRDGGSKKKLNTRKKARNKIRANNSEPITSKSSHR